MDREYRLVRDLYKSWTIQERHVITRGGNAGDWSDWGDYKYPGNLENAINGLLMLGIPEDTGFQRVDDLLTAIADAEKRVMNWLTATILQ